MADVIFADCNLAELDVALGLTDQRQTSDVPDEPQLLIEALAKHGVEATSAPWNDPDVTWEAHRLCVLKRPWTHTRQPDAFLSWARYVSHHCELWNPLTVIEWNLHKRYLIELDRNGIPIMPTELITADEPRTIREVADQHGWTDLIVKPAISAGSIGIGHYHSDDSAAQSHATRLLANGDVLVQPFAPAIQQRGEISLVFIEDRFSHAVRKQPVGREFRAQLFFAIELVNCDPSEAEFEIATAALNAVPSETLYARIDLVDYDNSPVLTELELIDPYLFLDRVPLGLDRFKCALLRRHAFGAPHPRRTH